MNGTLSSPFQPWEVHDTTKQLASLKAPGLDGMPPLFYQNYWNLVGNDISHLVLNFLNTTSLPPHFNHTFITLIPKVKCLEFVSEFRFISLCNVLYKIFSKVSQ